MQLNALFLFLMTIVLTGQAHSSGPQPTLVDLDSVEVEENANSGHDDQAIDRKRRQKRIEEKRNERARRDADSCRSLERISKTTAADFAPDAPLQPASTVAQALEQGSQCLENVSFDEEEFPCKVGVLPYSHEMKKQYYACCRYDLRVRDRVSGDVVKSYADGQRGLSEEDLAMLKTSEMTIAGGMMPDIVFLGAVSVDVFSDNPLSERTRAILDSEANALMERYSCENDRD